VHGKATQTGSYCGGAAPSEAHLRQLQTPSPLSIKFLVRAGVQNSDAAPVATFTPGEAGAFSVSLPRGDYCVVREARSASVGGPPSQFVDEACMATWRLGCDAVWHVDAADVDGTFNLAQSCFGPCYSGPMPPAAARPR
jgi:hypothetical protein